MVDLTKEIKKALVEKDMTATQLAEKIGMSQGNLSTKMNKGTYSVEDLKKISEALEMNLVIELRNKE